MQSFKIPIVNSIDPTPGTPQQAVNGFGITVPDTFGGRDRKFFVNRPGFQAHATRTASGSAGTGMALIVWTGKGTGGQVVTAFGATNSMIHDGSASAGAITGGCTGIAETFIGANPTLIFSSTDNTGWYYDAGATVAVPTKIADGDFPGNAGKTLAGTFAVMDGYPFIMTTDGVLWAGDLNSITAWTATSFDSANSYPDKGIGCVRHKNFIVAFGAESIQFFYNTGLTPFPLSKASSMTMKIGAVSANLITQISDTLFFAGTTPQGGFSIFQYDGTIARISTPELERILITLGTTGCTMSAIRFFGRSFIIINTSSINQNYAYCVEEKQWFLLQNTSLQIRPWNKVASNTSGSALLNYAISTDDTTPFGYAGKVYKMDTSSYVYGTDDSQSFTTSSRIINVDFGTRKRKFFNYLELYGEGLTVAAPTLSFIKASTVLPAVATDAGTLKYTRIPSGINDALFMQYNGTTSIRVEGLTGQFEVGQ